MYLSVHLCKVVSRYRYQISKVSALILVSYLTYPGRGAASLISDLRFQISNLILVLPIPSHQSPPSRQCTDFQVPTTMEEN